MKELLGDITKHKSSLPLFLGVVLVILGISSGIQWGGNSLSIEPAYRITAIAIGCLLILVGVALLFWGENLHFGQDPKIKWLDHNPTDQREMQARLLKATQIDGFAYSLIHFVYDNQHTLAKAVMNGAVIRLVVIDPDGKSIEVMKGLKPTTGVAKDIIRVLETAKSIETESKKSIKGKFEIRVIDWISSCNLIIIDPASDHGWMEIGMFSPNYKKVVGGKAYFQLSRKTDKDWFDEYASQFNDIWEMAKPYEYK